MITTYIHQCTPQIAETTMMAIIKAESNGNNLAIGINKGYRLLYQPKDYHQAQSWVAYLEKNGYNFDIGIAQVNIKTVHKYGFSAVQALDICTNLKLAGYVLQQNYRSALIRSNSQQEALRKAISAYNTGNYHSGFNNGYVKKVVYNATGKLEKSFGKNTPSHKISLSNIFILERLN